MKSKISPFLWFDHQAEEAANFYVGIFPNSKITSVARYADAGKEIHGREPGSVMVVGFELDGQSFSALNGGPVFQFNESISFVIDCDTQEEIDRYFTALSAVPECEQCGWVKDKFGVSWQVVPKILAEFLMSDDKEAANRAMGAMMQMKKLDIAELKRAFAG